MKKPLSQLSKILTVSFIFVIISSLVGCGRQGPLYLSEPNKKATDRVKDFTSI